MHIDVMCLEGPNSYRIDKRGTIIIEPIRLSTKMKENILYIQQ